MKNKLFIIALLSVSVQVAVYGMQGLKRSSKQLFKVPKQSHMLQSRAFSKKPNMQLQKEPVQDFKPVPAENKSVDTEQLSTMKIKNNKGYRSYAKVGAAGGGLFAGLVAWWNGLFSSDIDSVDRDDINDVFAILPDGTDGFEGLAGDRKRNLEQIRKIVSSGKKHVYDSLDGEGQVIIYEGPIFSDTKKKLFGLKDRARPFVAIYKKDDGTVNAKMIMVVTFDEKDFPKNTRGYGKTEILSWSSKKDSNYREPGMQGTFQILTVFNFNDLLKDSKFNKTSFK